MIVLLAGAACCAAQQQEEGLLDRIQSSRNKAMQAINDYYSQPKPTLKRDRSLDSQFAGKKFGEGKITNLSKKAELKRFRAESKYASETYRTTRSFLGIKNPWFGTKVHSTESSPLLSKSLVKSLEKSYVIKDQAPVEAFYQADKRAERHAREVTTKTFLGRGSAQGAIDQISEKANKEMTIEDVRTILNKN